VSLRRLIVIGAHVALWTASYSLAFGLRFDFRWPDGFPRALSVWLPLLIVTRVAIFFGYGLFRGLWRYTGARDLIAIVGATTISSLVFATFMAFGLGPIPRSIPIIEWLGAIFLVGGMRFAIRAVHTQATQLVSKEAGARRILIVGAGDAGEMLLREIQNQRARYEPVGFADDDRRKIGERIHGIKVLGRTCDLAQLAIDHAVEEILIAIPSASGAQMRRIVGFCKASGVRFRTIPGLDHLIHGRVTVSQLRDIAIEDLLRREPVQLDTDQISETVAGKIVLVSGAGGSIGSEVCRQVCRFGPASLILLEHGENSLFNIHRELQERFGGIDLVPCIADVTDEPRLREIFAEHRPEVVFHAAAHKHVPMMEWNPGEAVKNNVFGTKTLADVSDEFAVRRFVMISSDKAVNPTSVMGVSKRVAEIYVQALSQRSETRFVTVRFGNVLGSAGSVIPIFKQQIATGGPITITHPDMQRYFMTIPEASQLVLQAGSMGRGGEIFILDMGQPVKIVELARDLVTFSGLTPDVEIEIKFTGVRPGEKLSEELAVDAERRETTSHPKIFVGRFRPHSWELLQRQLRELGALADGRDQDIRKKFGEIVPEYRPTVPSEMPLPDVQPALRVVGR
jgi:FlaA1/EpsC-like NDP-sugar epimerase